MDLAAEKTEPQQARWQRAGELVLVAAFFGLATGFVETAILQFREVILDNFVWMTRYHAWMAPTVYLLLFTLLGAVVALLGGLFPRRVTLSRATYLFAFLSALILTLPFGKLSTWAAAILALGVAVQVGRVIAPRQRGFLRRARYATAAMLLLIPLLAAALRLLPSWRETRALAGLPTPAADAPSVLLIILDTVRSASMGLYGHRQPTTPKLEHWLQRGVVFDRAISTASWTLPAHASLFTGRWVHELGVDYETPLDDTYPTLAEVLQSRGYATAGFVANDRYTSFDSGLDRGFLRYEDYLHTPKEFWRSAMLMQTGLFRSFSTARSIRGVLWALREHNLRIPEGRWGERKRAEMVSGEFLDWASGVQGRPFFAFLNYFDAHHQYRCPPPFRDRFDCTASKLNAYHGSIAYLDDRLDQLFRDMAERGLLDNTLVVITSDHGEHFGENGINGHGSSLYMPVLHVPLMMFWDDRLPGGTRVHEAVSVRDVAGTIAELAGLTRGEHPFPGASLARYWTTGQDAAAPPASDAAEPILSQIISAPFRSGVYTGGDARISVVEAGRLYILNDGGREELYAYETDPNAARNLVNLEGERGTLQRLRALTATLEPQQRRLGAVTSGGGANGGPH